jgi:hypothetical protein
MSTTFYNTIGETGQTLKESLQNCRTQEEEILAIFKLKGIPLTPFEVQAIYQGIRDVPITSIRRAITNLTLPPDYKLIKLNKKRKGNYGKMNFLWKYNGGMDEDLYLQAGVCCYCHEDIKATKVNLIGLPRIGDGKPEYGNDWLRIRGLASAIVCDGCVKDAMAISGIADIPLVRSVSFEDKGYRIRYSDNLPQAPVIRYFVDTPFRGDPLCKCSYCNEPITENNIMERITYPPTDQYREGLEVRLHEKCRSILENKKCLHVIDDITWFTAVAEIVESEIL